MDKSVIDAIEKFYKMKQTYDSAIKKARKAVSKDKTLTKQQKRQKLAQIKTKCINCGKQGGTIFTVTSEVLRAQCGNEQPCPLDLHIQKGAYENVLTTISYLKEAEESTKSSIIRTKLDLLFGYSSEDEALSQFEKLRSTLKEDQDLREIIDTAATNIITRPNIQDKLKSMKQNLFVEKERLRALSNEFKIARDPSKINDMVEVYVGDPKTNQTPVSPSDIDELPSIITYNGIKDLVMKIQDLEYAISAIECSDGVSPPCDQETHLIQKPYGYAELQYPIGDEVTLINDQE
jgi:hypothetical protein